MTTTTTATDPIGDDANRNGPAPPAPPATDGTTRASTTPTASTAPQYHPLTRRVAAGLRRRCGVGEGAAVLVAVSGGRDSVALLRALALLAPRRRWRLRLVVGHVDHGLRPESADDARFVRNLADTLGLPFAAAVLAGLRDQPGNLEANARAARYAALHRLAHDAGCPLIAVAHHADDQLETMLLRLVRGATPAGLAAMPWRRALLDPPADGPSLVRPMLDCPRPLLSDFLKKTNQRWREDPTNADASRARARLRRDVLPVLRELNPAAAEHATALADRLRAAP